MYRMESKVQAGLQKTVFRTLKHRDYHRWDAPFRFIQTLSEILQIIPELKHFGRKKE